MYLAVVLLARARCSQFDASALGTAPQRLLEVEMLEAPDELDDIATRGARAEAMPGVALRIDGERGGALAVEGARGLPRASAPLQRRDIATHGLDDVELRFDVFNRSHCIE